MVRQAAVMQIKKGAHRGFLSFFINLWSSAICTYNYEYWQKSVPNKCFQFTGEVAVGGSKFAVMLGITHGHAVFA